MSMTKRRIDDIVEELAKETGYSWDYLMQRLEDCEFDWELVKTAAEEHVL